MWKCTKCGQVNEKTKLMCQRCGHIKDDWKPSKPYLTGLIKLVQSSVGMGNPMKLIALILMLCFSQLSFARDDFDILVQGPGSATIQATASGNSIATLVNRTTASGKTFFLDSLILEGYLDVVSSTARQIGTCDVQVPSGTTVGHFQFINPTTSQTERIVWSAHIPVVAGTSFVVKCGPTLLQSLQVDWNVNYFGFEY